MIPQINISQAFLGEFKEKKHRYLTPYYTEVYITLQSPAYYL